MRKSLQQSGSDFSTTGNPTKEIPMGDKSPKSVQKSASQKQSKAAGANQKKQDLITAQQATKAKLAANKKK
jgi:hypothetical protein